MQKRATVDTNVGSAHSHMANTEEKHFSTAFFLASGFYSGTISVAPGTIGSLACLPLWLAVHTALGPLSLTTRACVAVAVACIGLWATRTTIVNRPQAGKDPQFIVIDEWSGMFVALLWVEQISWVALLLSFSAFRLFDITKPGPIRRAEELPGAWGIMADDLLAGVMACLLAYGFSIGLGKV